MEHEQRLRDELEEPPALVDADEAAWLAVAGKLLDALYIMTVKAAGIWTDMQEHGRRSFASFASHGPAVWLRRAPSGGARPDHSYEGEAAHGRWRALRRGVHARPRPMRRRRA